jgi:hypothetical protein
MFKRFARRLGQRLLAYADPPPVPVVPVVRPDPVMRVLEHACYQAGWDTHDFTELTDLAQSGKLPEVLYYTARELGPSSALQTVGAIAAAFKGAR